jgi:hypothetical protein
MNRAHKFFEACWRILLHAPIVRLLVKTWPFVLLAIQMIFVSGCTSALWGKDTFAHDYRPAAPANLHLYYSTERKDVLVQYDESSNPEKAARPRFYWLEPNTIRINGRRKPHFVSAKARADLMSIPVSEALPDSITPGSNGLYAVSERKENLFTLYSDKEEFDPYQLPSYRGGSQRVKQVLLTPFAVAIDATLIGAVFGFYAAPGILASLNR